LVVFCPVSLLRSPHTRFDAITKVRPDGIGEHGKRVGIG
jgi:hypothetical protein